LEIPVLLVAIYLLKGRRASFPSAYHATGGGLANEFRFHAVRLWEHRDRIRSGTCPSLLRCWYCAKMNPRNKPCAMCAS
jgi:hypothetical protein